MKIKADTIIENGLLLTINNENEILPDSSIVISEDRIIDIDNAKKISSLYEAKNYINAEQKIVMPGFINTHTHSGMTLLRGFADDLPLQIWLERYIFPAEARFINKNFVETSLKLAMIEMILSGTTTFNDMYFFQKNAAETVIEVGMRALLSESIANFPVPGNPSFKDALKYSEEFIEQYQNNKLITPCVGVHTPFTSNKEILQKAKELAKNKNTLFNIHLAETQWETDTINKQYGKSPTQWLHDLGILDAQTIAVHSVHLSPKDIEIFKNQNVKVAHNPECNMKISSGAAPISTYLEKGIKVGLGTDGAASNNNLDLFEEMHTMALLHKLITGNPTTLPASECVRIATMGGAEVIGMEKEIGSLEKGKKADIITLKLDSPHAVPMYNPYSTIVYSLNSNDVNDSIINGRIIMKDRKILSTDTQKIMHDAKIIADEIKNTMSKPSTIH